MVRTFQSIIGKEARQQILQMTGALPHEVIACVGGGSNAIGIFSAFIDDKDVLLTGVEAGGHGIDGKMHAARLCKSEHSRPGILHGSYSYVLQDENGQIADTHSISAGLDYSGIGPEHSYLNEIERVKYTYATDEDAIRGFTTLCELEGIIPALESSHAVAYTLKRAPQLEKNQTIIVNLSGRGDKDIFSVADHLGKSI
jgi:tryptophan synthase beta chain